MKAFPESAGVRSRNGYLPLHCLLRQKNPDLALVATLVQMYPYAVQMIAVDFVPEDENADPDEWEGTMVERRWTPLSRAVQLENRAITTLLLSKGALSPPSTARPDSAPNTLAPVDTMQGTTPLLATSIATVTETIRMEAGPEAASIVASTANKASFGYISSEEQVQQLTDLLRDSSEARKSSKSKKTNDSKTSTDNEKDKKKREFELEKRIKQLEDEKRIKQFEDEKRNKLLEEERKKSKQLEKEKAQLEAQLKSSQRSFIENEDDTNNIASSAVEVDRYASATGESISMELHLEEIGDETDIGSQNSTIDDQRLAGSSELTNLRVKKSSLDEASPSASAKESGVSASRSRPKPPGRPTTPTSQPADPMAEIAMLMLSMKDNPKETAITKREGGKEFSSSPALERLRAPVVDYTSPFMNSIEDIQKPQISFGSVLVGAQQGRDVARVTPLSDLQLPRIQTQLTTRATTNSGHNNSVTSPHSEEVEAGVSVLAKIKDKKGLGIYQARDDEFVTEVDTVRFPKLVSAKEATHLRSAMQNFNKVNDMYTKDAIANSSMEEDMLRDYVYSDVNESITGSLGIGSWSGKMRQGSDKFDQVLDFDDNISAASNSSSKRVRFSDKKKSGKS